MILSKKPLLHCSGFFVFFALFIAEKKADKRSAGDLRTAQTARMAITILALGRFFGAGLL